MSALSEKWAPSHEDDLVFLCRVHDQVVAFQCFDNPDQLFFVVYEGFVRAFAHRLSLVHGHVALPNSVQSTLALPILQSIHYFEHQFLLSHICGLVYWLGREQLLNLRIVVNFQLLL